jgi:P pilus assembly chaperone PapD
MSTHTFAKLLSHAALALCAMTFCAMTAHAQFAIDKTELILRPDAPQLRTGVLMVRNEGATAAQATIKIEDWDRAANGTNQFYPAGTRAGSCSPMLKVFPLAISLRPGESQAIRIDFDAPAEASLTKECWSLVVVETAVPRPQASGRTLIYNVRTGLKVYVAPTNLKIEAQVDDIRLEDALTEDVAPKIDATVKFTNVGELHVVGKGRLEIRRDDNSLVQAVTLPTMYALPGATMEGKATLAALPKGRYVLVAIIDYGGRELAAGSIEHEVK